MASEKLLAQMQFPWQAEQLKNLLLQEGISCRLIQGSREYTAIIMGGTGNPMFVFVDKENFEKAEAIKKQYFKDIGQPITNFKLNSVKQTARSYFNKILILNLLSVVLIPIITNISATKKYNEMNQIYPDDLLTKAAGVITLIFWAAVIGGFIFIYKGCQGLYGLFGV